MKLADIARKLRLRGGSVAHIFLSYSRKDSNAAKVIAGALSEHGHDVWWDTKISGGAKFAAEIEHALAAAEIVVVLWSSDAIASTWVLDEAAEGRDTGRLLPVVLDECKPPLGFRQFQTIAAAGRLDAAAGEIVEVVARSGGGKHASTSSSASHLTAARRLGDEGRFEDAWREIGKALAAEGDSGQAEQEAGWLLYVRGRAAEAIAHYERAAAASKADHESPAMLVSCYRAISDQAASRRAAALALARAEQAIAAGLGGGVPFASGAKGLAALGHPERARKWVRKALAVDPGNLSMRYTLASTIACFLGDTDLAIDVLEPYVEAASNRMHLQLLEADPDWTQIRETREFQSLLARARKRVEALKSTSFA